MTEETNFDVSKTTSTKTETIYKKLYQLDSDIPEDEQDLDNVKSLEGIYNADEMITGFIGGIEVPIADLNLVYSTSTDEEGNTVNVTYGDKFPYILSLDGTKAIIRCVNPVSKKSWYSATWDTVKKFCDQWGIIYTKSMTEDLIKSEYYLESGDEEI